LGPLRFSGRNRRSGHSHQRHEVYAPLLSNVRPRRVEAIADENFGGAEKAVNAAMVVVGTVSGYGTYRLLLFANNLLLTLMALRCFNSCPQKGFGFSCRSLVLCVFLGTSHSGYGR
jgi:hypothetical protein